MSESGELELSDYYELTSFDTCSFFKCFKDNSVNFFFLGSYPTNPFTILKPQDQEIDEFYAVSERRAMDFEAPKL